MMRLTDAGSANWRLSVIDLNSTNGTTVQRWTGGGFDPAKPVPADQETHLGTRDRLILGDTPSCCACPASATWPSRPARTPEAAAGSARPAGRDRRHPQAALIRSGNELCLPSARPRLDPHDPAGIDTLLSPRRSCAVRQTVRDFCADKILPHVADWYEKGELPGVRELARELGKIGLLGMHLTGYGCAGMSAVDYGLACLELEAADSGLRSLVSVQGSLAMFAIWKFGREAHKTEWLPRMAAGRGHRLLRPHRAGRGLRPGVDADLGGAVRVRLGAQRPQDVDHQRHRRRRRRGLGADRRRHPRVRRARRTRRGSPRRRSSTRGRCAPPSPPSSSSTRSGCPPTRCCPR